MAEIINKLYSITSPLQRPTMTIQLKKLQSPTPILTDWDNAVVDPPDIPPAHLASLPSPPTAWLSARDMKVFGSTPLKEQIGIVRCKQCDRPVLRSAFADHLGQLFHPSAYQNVCLAGWNSQLFHNTRGARQEGWQGNRRYNIGSLATNFYSNLLKT